MSSLIHGRFMDLHNHFPWHRWPRSTYMAIQEEEPMTCMSYFPIIVKVSHLQALREHMASKWQVPFDNAFARLSGVPYSQFNIMCTYFFWHKQEEYTWKIRDLSPNWDGFHPPPVYAQWGDRSAFKPGMLSILPATTIHMRRRDDSKVPNLVGIPKNMLRLLLQGVCHSVNFRDVLFDGNSSGAVEGEGHYYAYNICEKYLQQPNNQYFVEMFNFELADYTTVLNETQLIALHTERQERLMGCNVSSLAIQEFQKTFKSYTAQGLESLLL